MNNKVFLLILFLFSLFSNAQNSEKCQKFEMFLEAIIKEKNNFLGQNESSQLKDYHLNIQMQKDIDPFWIIGNSIKDSLHIEKVHYDSYDFSDCLEKYNYNPLKSNINIIISKTEHIDNYGDVMDVEMFDRAFITRHNAFFEISVLFEDSEILMINSRINHLTRKEGFNFFDDHL